jgi:hypothetical protein
MNSSPFYCGKEESEFRLGYAGKALATNVRPRVNIQNVLWRTVVSYWIAVF